MPSLIYAPVHSLPPASIRSVANNLSSGLRPPDGGDGHFWPSYRSFASYSQTQARQLDLRERLGG